MIEFQKYFAYGSNMHPARLEKRIGPCDIISVARLQRAELRFHKIGLDRSGKCDIVFQQNYSMEVWGVVYQISERQKSRLDQYESLGQGYQILNTEVLTQQNQSMNVFTYQAMPQYIDHSLKPFDWYHELVMLGAQFHKFPVSYLDELQQVPFLPDSDQKSVSKHQNLLNTIRKKQQSNFDENDQILNYEDQTQ